MSDNEKETKSPTMIDEDELKKQSELVTEDDEYEYVPILEASQGFMGSVFAFLKEYGFIVACVLLAGVCIILSNIGNNMTSIFIGIAFAFIAAVVAFFLYDAWKKKKVADEIYRHALDVRAPVKQKMSGIDSTEDDADSNDSEEAKETEDEK